MDIFKASSANDLTQVTRLLEQDPQLIEARDRDERIALHHAALHNSLAVIQFLLSKGADPNASSICGDSPLHLAQKPETVTLLIDAGAEPHNEDNTGVSPMDWAVREGREDLFWELTRASNCYSPTFQFLAACQKAGLAASTEMGGDYHCITVERLGHQAGKECCLGWRHGGKIAGWNCYPIDELEHCFFGDPLEELPDPDRSSRPTGTIGDIYPFSLPRNCSWFKRIFTTGKHSTNCWMNRSCKSAHVPVRARPASFFENTLLMESSPTPKAPWCCATSTSEN